MGVIINTLKSIAFALIFTVCQVALAQQVPVTRAEFATLFAGIGRGYVSPADVEKSLTGLPKDEKSVTKTEVALAMIELARLAGKHTLFHARDPLELLAGSKILSKEDTFFANPGMHFRPSDLVGVMVSFASGMADRLSPVRSAEPLLRQPRIGRGSGI
ncbi:MAG: hypothetical protein M3R13_00760 [Armatimonadota bacterium]|nr:hypothetical protein [Armatimonadota bacterium]